jgi:hypothetical protein
MKRLDFSIYTKLVRPIARLAIGWVGALIFIVAGVAVIFGALGLQIK